MAPASGNHLDGEVVGSLADLYPTSLPSSSLARLSSLQQAVHKPPKQHRQCDAPPAPRHDTHRTPIPISLDLRRRAESSYLEFVLYLHDADGRSALLAVVSPVLLAEVHRVAAEDRAAVAGHHEVCGRMPCYRLQAPDVSNSVRSSFLQRHR